MLLAPCAGDGLHDDRVQVSAPAMLVGEASATTLALVVHEPATSSIKYGALSAGTGKVDVFCAADDRDAVVT